jgi:hypothetical protein
MPSVDRLRAMLVTGTLALLLPAFIALLIADTSRSRPDAGPAMADDGSDAGADAVPADVTAPPAAALHSRWVTQSPLRVITLGSTTTLSITYRNVGSAAWVRGSAVEARLGVVDDDRRFYDLGFAQNWPAPDRPAVQTESVVPPGALASFSFQVRGTVTGVHRIPLRPLVEGVTWMEDEGAYVELWVR